MAKTGTKELKKMLDEFDKFGDYTESKIKRDIESNRKGQFVLTFTDKNGNNLSGVDVKVKQITHEFKFGCTTFGLGMFDSDEKNRMYEEKFAKLFNFGVVPFYWEGLEPKQGKPRFEKHSEFVYRRPPIDTSVEFCKRYNMRMKGHCLVYNSFQPDWISNDNRELKIQIDNRIKAIADRYGNTFCDFDVINEMTTIYRNCYPGNGCRNLQITDETDHEKWAFDMCKRYFPYSTLYWNEGNCESLGDRYYKGHRTYYYLTLKDHLMRGTPIEGVGIQYHLLASIIEEGVQTINGYSEDDLKNQCNPLRIFDALEKYGEFNLPISISEVSIPAYTCDEETEHYQAEIAKRLYSIWFSQKNVDSIVYWNLIDNLTYATEDLYQQGILRKDFSEKPIYNALYDLIHNEWHTEFETKVNERLDFFGFYGDYEVEAVLNGKKVTKIVRLFRDTTGYDNRLVDFRAVNIEI